MSETYPTLGEATKVWARIAALSFGGPAGQIAVMHRILVEEKRWLGDERFLHALNFCMLLPGPEAQQLATYIGWLMHGVRGALIAGLLFIAPGMLAIMALSWAYVVFGDVKLIQGVFFGLKAAVLAIVIQAVIRLAKRALKNAAMRSLAVASFIAIFLLSVPFPVIVILAALTGWCGANFGFSSFVSGSGEAVTASQVGEKNTLLEQGGYQKHSVKGLIAAGIGALGLWLMPVVLLVFFAPQSVFADVALFFSKLAVLTFGGAYAALGWVAQDAVGIYGWLAPVEMLDGLGMAETTPGPLIMVLQFVGFLAAFREAGWATPLWAGTVGGLLTTWVTFAPCFAWIFLGAPIMETLRKNVAIAAALTAVTAAVVGVILNLAIWFALHLIWKDVTAWDFGPIAVALPLLQSFNAPAALLSAAALIAVFRFNLGLTVVLGGAALGGILFVFAGLV